MNPLAHNPIRTGDLMARRGRSAGACVHCGECCRVPGILLPDQVEVLADFLDIDRQGLFHRYLIAELCTPADELPPAFVLAPVKAEEDGRRLPHRLLDFDYRMTGHLWCIFRDPGKRRCTVHPVKPFGCSTLICSRTTQGQPIAYDKTHYYWQWIHAQDMIFSILPELEPLWVRVEQVVRRFRKTPRLRREMLAERNRLLKNDVARILNGRAVAGVCLHP